MRLLASTSRIAMAGGLTASQARSVAAAADAAQEKIRFGEIVRMALAQAMEIARGRV